MNENKELENELHTDIENQEKDAYYPATYVVYGMAIGLAVGAIAMYLFDSRLALSACVFIGTVIGYFIKKGDPDEK